MGRSWTLAPSYHSDYLYYVAVLEGDGVVRGAFDDLPVVLDRDRTRVYS
jgi:hypothetical protein